MTKGDRYERKLANVFDETPGWAVIKTGSSGRGTSEDRVDLMVGDGYVVWVVEAKYSSSPNIYEAPEKVEALRDYARAFKGEPVIFPRWNTRKVDCVDEADWYPVHVDFLSQTDSGNYAINASTIVEQFEPLSYYLECDMNE